MQTNFAHRFTQIAGSRRIKPLFGTGQMTIKQQTLITAISDG